MSALGNNLLNGNMGASTIPSIPIGGTEGIAPWLIVGGIVVLAVIVALILQYMEVFQWTMPAWTNAPMTWVPGFGEPRRLSDWGELMPVDKSVAGASPAAAAGGVPGSVPSGQTWCFVGEDLAGRWCVKVPNPQACSPERVFNNRADCELVRASHMPLGIDTKGGSAMLPLSATHTA
jgi:hypothetical protein